MEKEKEFLSAEQILKSFFVEPYPEDLTPFNEAREQDSAKAYKYVDYAHFSNKNPLN